MITAKKTSEQRNVNITYNFTKRREEYSTKPLELAYYNCGDHIACIYDSDWYIELVVEVCEEEGDVKVRFMHPKGPGRPENCFFWPSTEDICYIPQTDMLCNISPPIASSKSARKYRISSLDAELITNNIESRVKNLSS